VPLRRVPAGRYPRSRPRAATESWRETTTRSFLVTADARCIEYTPSGAEPDRRRSSRDQEERRLHARSRDLAMRSDAAQLRIASAHVSHRVGICAESEVERRRARSMYASRSLTSYRTACPSFTNRGPLPCRCHFWSVRKLTPRSSEVSRSVTSRDMGDCFRKRHATWPSARAARNVNAGSAGEHHSAWV